MDTIVIKSFNVWCIFLLLLFAVLLGLSFTLHRSSFLIGLPYTLVLALVFLLFTITNCFTPSKRHIPMVLPLVCTAIIVLIAWSMVAQVGLSTRNALDLSLTKTMSLIQGQVAAQAELESYVRSQVSRKMWYLALLLMFINVDALRLTGVTLNALYVHLAPVIAIVVATYCTDEVSNKSIDVLNVAAIFAVYTISSSLHMLVMFRDRFRIDYQLRQRMAKEAEMMEVAKDVEVAQRQASQKADSMLNHILKNIMAEAHGCIDLFQGHCGAVGADYHLRQAQEGLERGMRWCKKRQVMVQVNSGDYTPILAPTSLRTLIDGIVYGRDITVDIADVTVCLDSLLCEVVLDNAISNAFRHGDTTLGPISLVVNATHTGEEHSMEVTFTLTNYVPDDHSPITPELVSRLATGHDVDGLASVSALSDHLGVRHMFMAAAAHHMTATLEQVGNLVIFTATLEVDLADGVDLESETSTPSTPLVPHTSVAFPQGLWIICLMTPISRGVCCCTAWPPMPHRPSARPTAPPPRRSRRLRRRHSTVPTSSSWTSTWTTTVSPYTAPTSRSAFDREGTPASSACAPPTRRTRTRRCTCEAAPTAWWGRTFPSETWWRRCSRYTSTSAPCRPLRHSQNPVNPRVCAVASSTFFHLYSTALCQTLPAPPPTTALPSGHAV
eukprot:GGOE01012879.1.p1 GENE.GGOE01012879.1~~GGOE01012879.1.p1  ORF type:complete len:694 (-),score=140.97 GGOE01012879.1:1029-3029(-)